MEETVYVLLDGEEVKVEKVNDEDISLKEMYRLINCDLVELVRLTDNINIWVDEEGLLKSGNVVTEIISDDMKIKLAGKILFLKEDKDGKSIGLNSEDIKFLNSNLKYRIVGFTQ